MWRIKLEGDLWLVLYGDSERFKSVFKLVSYVSTRISHDCSTSTSFTKELRLLTARNFDHW